MTEDTQILLGRVRLARLLLEYSFNQPRDARGRWTARTALINHAYNQRNGNSNRQAGDAQKLRQLGVPVPPTPHHAHQMVPKLGTPGDTAVHALMTGHEPDAEAYQKLVDHVSTAGFGTHLTQPSPAMIGEGITVRGRSFKKEDRIPVAEEHLHAHTHDGMLAEQVTPEQYLDIGHRAVKKAVKSFAFLHPETGSPMVWFLAPNVLKKHEKGNTTDPRNAANHPITSVLYDVDNHIIRSIHNRDVEPKQLRGDAWLKRPT